MGRKAYRVSKRQPGCRNILKRYKAPAFLRSEFKSALKPKYFYFIILYIITYKVVDISIICCKFPMKSLFSWDTIYEYVKQGEINPGIAPDEQVGTREKSRGFNVDNRSYRARREMPYGNHAENNPGSWIQS